MKVIFFGTPNFAVPALKTLIDNGYNISAVFTGQGPIKNLADKYSIKVLQPTSLKKDDQVFEEFKNLKPDICIIAAYGKIIPQKFLDIPHYGFINIHPSLLPKYRGPSPIQTAILNGDKKTGVAIMLVDAEVDHGSILALQEFPITNFQFSKLQDELAKLGAKLLIETLPKYLSGKVNLKEQNHDQATFTKMFKREDGRINWSKPAQQIYNQICALNPEPGTWTTWKGKIINIPTCDVGNQQNVDLVPGMTPGMIRRVGDDIVIGTGTSHLILKSIQLEGRKEMDAKDFVNGHSTFLNSKLD